LTHGEIYFKIYKKHENFLPNVANCFWNSSDDIIEGVGREFMLRLHDEASSELRIEELEDAREFNGEEIDQIKEVNKDIFNEYLIKEIKLTTSTKVFLKRIQQDMKIEVATKICHGEIQAEKMKVNKVQDVLRNYELWKSYRDNLTSKNDS